MPLLGEFLAKGEGREVFDSEPTTHSPSRDMARFREMFPQQYVQVSLQYIANFESLRFNTLLQQLSCKNFCVSLKEVGVILSTWNSQ